MLKTPRLLLKITDDTPLSQRSSSNSLNNDSEINLIHTEFKDLLKYTTTVENINNFGIQIESKKIKHTFTKSLKKKDLMRGKGLPVILNYYLNTSISIFTKVFLYSVIDEADKQSILNKTLSEIYYHKQFEEILKKYKMNENNSCLFQMPKIKNYGFIKNKENIPGNSDEKMEAFYIQMTSIPPEFYSIGSLKSKNRCDVIRNKLLIITDSLGRDNLFHNDIHRFNIFTNDNNDIFLIDFGEANSEMNTSNTWDWNGQLCNFIKG